MYIFFKFSHRMNMKVTRTLLSFMSTLVFWRSLDVSDWGFITYKVYVWLNVPFNQILTFYIEYEDLKCLNVCIGCVEDTGSSCLWSHYLKRICIGEDVLMYICIKFQVFRINMRVTRSFLFLMTALGLCMTLKVPDWSFVTWKV